MNRFFKAIFQKYKTIVPPLQRKKATIPCNMKGCHLRVACREISFLPSQASGQPHGLRQCSADRNCRPIVKHARTHAPCPWQWNVKRRKRRTQPKRTVGHSAKPNPWRTRGCRSRPARGPFRRTVDVVVEGRKEPVRRFVYLPLSDSIVASCVRLCFAPHFHSQFSFFRVLARRDEKSGMKRGWEAYLWHRS